MADSGSGSGGHDGEEGDYNIPSFVGGLNAAQRRVQQLRERQERIERLGNRCQELQRVLNQYDRPSSDPRQGLTAEDSRAQAENRRELAESQHEVVVSVAAFVSLSRNNAAANLPHARLPSYGVDEFQDQRPQIRLPDSFNGIPDDRAAGPTHWSPRIHRDDQRRPPPTREEWENQQLHGIFQRGTFLNGRPLPRPGDILHLPVWSPSLPVPNARPSPMDTQEDRGNATNHPNYPQDLPGSQAPPHYSPIHPQGAQGAHHINGYHNNLYPSQPSLPPASNTNSYSYQYNSYNSGYRSSSTLDPASSSPAEGARPLERHGAFPPPPRGNDDNLFPRIGHGAPSLPLGQAPQVSAPFQAFTNHSASANPEPYQFGSRARAWLEEPYQMGNHARAYLELQYDREQQAIQASQASLNDRRHNERYGHGYHRAGESHQSQTLAPVERSAGAGALGPFPTTSMPFPPPHLLPSLSSGASAPATTSRAIGATAGPRLPFEGQGPHPAPTPATTSALNRAVQALAGEETSTPLPDPDGDTAMADEHHNGDTTEDDEGFEGRSRQQRQQGQRPEDTCESLPPPPEPRSRNSRDLEEA